VANPVGNSGNWNAEPRPITKLAAKLTRHVGVLWSGRQIEVSKKIQNVSSLDGHAGGRYRL